MRRISNGRTSIFKPPLLGNFIPPFTVTRREFEMTVWGAVATRLLTGRGSLNRESESFSTILWGPVATIMVAFAPQRLSLEPEKTAGRRGSAETLGVQRGNEERRGLSPSASCVNWWGTEVPVTEVGSPTGPRTEQNPRRRLGRLRLITQDVTANTAFSCVAENPPNWPILLGLPSGNGGNMKPGSNRQILS